MHSYAMTILQVEVSIINTVCYPSIIFDDDKMWSFNIFAATGDDSLSSHNTTDDGNVDAILFASRFLPHENEKTKTEIGILPTCIGRVSSTVLSKDGRIAGLRHVVDAQAIENLKSR